MMDRAWAWPPPAGAAAPGCGASSDALLQAVIGDSVSPAICMNEGCDYTCEMEPDQRRGWCDECRTNTMKAAPVLAGII
jgi:hypothetical protein